MKPIHQKAIKRKLSFLLICLIFFSVFQVSIFSTTSPEETLREKLETELSKDAKVVITVKRITEGTNCILQGSVTNVSSTPLQNLTINGMAFKDRQESGFRYSVVDIFEEQKVTVAILNPKEVQKFEMVIPGINWDGLNLHGVIFVQVEQGATKEILQAAYVD
ncbi:MAG TPA: hypothetical protein VFC91_02710 [Atribacterota bacterium]|nr:hypothetical protein [Atribacterota bacterium]